MGLDGAHFSAAAREAKRDSRCECLSRGLDWLTHRTLVDESLGGVVYEVHPVDRGLFAHEL